jgi:hypothetical protein
MALPAFTVFHVGGLSTGGKKPLKLKLLLVSTANRKMEK